MVIPEGGSLELAISLSPTLATGEMRFVLTWGELPAVIDSHLKTPSIEGTSYHIYYESQGSATNPPFAILDIDITDSYGPETTTIYELYPGEYHFYIFNYDETPAITTSGAVVQIFNENGLISALQVPTTGDGLYWDICTVNGSIGAVNIINTITNNEPGGKSFDIMPPKIKATSRNIVSWNWNFGDGGTSTAQNPAHTYTANGNYTVSLTVSDGTTSKTETKNNMIVVGPIGIDEVYENQVTIFPNPVGKQLIINSDEVIPTAAIYNITGQKLVSKKNNSKNLEIDLNDLSSGTYILITTTEKGIRQMKFSRNN